MKKLRILSVVILAVVLITLGCAGEEHVDKVICLKEPAIPADADCIKMTHIRCGEEKTYTIDGENLEELKAWAARLSVVDELKFKDGEYPGQDEEGGEIFQFDLGAGHSPVSYCIFSDCYLVIGQTWYLVGNPTPPPVELSFSSGCEAVNPEDGHSDSQVEYQYQKAYENCLEYIAENDELSQQKIDTSLVSAAKLDNGEKEDVFIVVDGTMEKDYFSEISSEHWVFTIGDTSELNYCRLVCDSETNGVIGYLPVTAVCGDDILGLHLTAEAAAADGLTLCCRRSGGMAKGKLMTGEAYFLEREISGRWETVSMKTEAAWEDVAYEIEADKTIRWKIDWSELYGELPDGKYRIGKEIDDLTAAGVYDSYTYYAEFEIKGGAF